MKPRYEQVDHTADLAVRVYGRTLRQFFANAAYAMFSQLIDLERIAPELQREVKVQGIDHESLLVNWLNELLYLQDTHREAYVAFQIHKLSQRRLQATVAGAQTEAFQTIIKAATYNELSITRTHGWYMSTVVFDV